MAEYEKQEQGQGMIQDEHGPAQPFMNPELEFCMRRSNQVPELVCGRSPQHLGDHEYNYGGRRWFEPKDSTGVGRYDATAQPNSSPVCDISSRYVPEKRCFLTRNHVGSHAFKDSANTPWFELNQQSALAYVNPAAGNELQQAFQQGGDIQRALVGIDEVKGLVRSHSENLAGLNTALGDFRDKVMQPIKKELEFLRYNLGDKANATVSQMQGCLLHMDKLFDAILKMSGKDEATIRKVREELGIPRNVPTIEELEKTGRPFVEYDAMLAAQQNSIEQNARLLALLEKRDGQIASLTQRLEALESPRGAGVDGSPVHAVGPEDAPVVDAASAQGGAP